MFIIYKILSTAKYPTIYLSLISFFIIATSIIIFGHGIYFIASSIQPIPFMDHMDMLINAIKYLDGSNENYIIRPHNEHRTITTNIFLLLDIVAFGGKGYFLIILNVIMMNSILGILSMMFYAIIDHRHVWFTAVSFTTLLLSLGVNIDNIMWATQIQFHLVIFFSIISFAVFSQGVLSQNYSYIILSIVSAFASTFSMANGLLVWPIMFLGTLFFRASWRTLAMVSVAGSVAWLTYFYLPGPVLPRASDRTFDLINFLVFTLLYIGGPVSSWSQNAGIAISSIGVMVLFIVNIKILMQSRPDKSTWIALVLLLDMIVASALMTAFGRSRAGATPITEPRYYLPALVFWSSFFALSVSSHITCTRTIARTVVGGIATVLALCVLSRHFYEISRWQEQIHDAWIVNAAIITGIEDPDQFRRVYPWTGRVQQLRPIIESHHLSAFATSLPQLLGKHFSSAEMAILPVCNGAVEFLKSLPTQTKQHYGAKLQGWLDAPGRLQQSDVLLTLDEAGNVIGIGAATPPTTNLMTLTSKPRLWTGYAAYDEASGYSTIIVLDGASANPRCRLNVAGELPQQRQVTTLGEAITAPVQIAGQWALSGFSQSIADPALPVPVYGSWTGADQNTGSIRFGPFSLPTNKKALSLLISRGPTSNGLSLAIVTGNNTSIKEVSVSSLTAHEWTALEINLPPGAPSDGLYLLAADKGTEWGAWFALSGPYSIGSK